MLAFRAVCPRSTEPHSAACGRTVMGTGVVCRDRIGVPSLEAESQGAQFDVLSPVTPDGSYGTVDLDARPHRPGGHVDGQVLGQQGSVARVPITTSAAWGRPVQQAGLTDTMLAVPTLSTATKPTSASFLTWWEQVDRLIPNASARSPRSRM